MGPRVLAHAPEELTRAPLRRLGEGIGKVVYASDHWVVKRERSDSAIRALILIWKALRRLEHLIPGSLGRRLLERPSGQLRLLRLIVQALMLPIPRGLWFMNHIEDVFRIYSRRDEEGEQLAAERLAGTSLVPRRVTFPPVTVRVGGWPGWLTVDEATERVEATLDQHLRRLAAAGQFREVERWLMKLLEMRPAGWSCGVFSVDSHLKNYGVSGDRVVLLDTGGLTDDWDAIEQRLAYEDAVQAPHEKLGLAGLLRDCPEVAARFDARWKEVVNAEVVRRHWPDGE